MIQTLRRNQEVRNLWGERVLSNHAGELVDLARRRRLEPHHQLPEPWNRQQTHREGSRGFQRERWAADVNECGDAIGSIDREPRRPKRTERVRDQGRVLQAKAAIDPVALVLESAQYEDSALGAAWRERMNFRHSVHVRFIERLAEHGDLSSEWEPSMAADLFYAVTLPGPWRELTRELGWTAEQYVAGMTLLLKRALLDAGR